MNRRPEQVSPSTTRMWRNAALLAFGATACAALLGGLSAWFLGSVAIAGMSAAALTFNFHTPGAFVRLLAIGRTVTKYGERLVGHNAALTDQVARRVSLFDAMAGAPSARASGWQLGDEARLADYLDDVEDVDFARLRADLPAGTGLAALGLLLLASALVAPLSVVPVLGFMLTTALAAQRLAVSGAAIWERRRAAQRKGARAFGMAMGSAVPLLGEGAWQAACSEALSDLSDADRMALPLARHQLATDALAGALAPFAMLSVISAAWIGGARGEALLLPLFVGFAWLAMGETLQGTSRIIVATFRRRAAQQALDRWTAGGTGETPHEPLPMRLDSLSNPMLVRRTPDGRAFGDAVTLRLRAGRPIVLAGASGSGKTSLLKQIVGWIGADSFTTGTRMLMPAERHAVATFCPHDAAILADSVRANLFAPHSDDETLLSALDAVEMRERIVLAGGLDAWITQDMLSLGEAQRINLARAWLSDRPLVLLDEPTEHLDAAQGERILKRIAARLSDRILVLSSHRPVKLDGSESIVLSHRGSAD